MSKVGGGSKGSRLQNVSLSGMQYFEGANELFKKKPAKGPKPGPKQEEADIKYELTAMGTIIEGDLGRLLNLVRKMHEAVIDAGVARVLTTVKVDDRRDKPSSMGGKVASVEEKLKV